MLAVLINMATSFNVSTMHQQDLLQANQFYVWIPWEAFQLVVACAKKNYGHKKHRTDSRKKHSEICS